MKLSSNFGGLTHRKWTGIIIKSLLLAAPLAISGQILQCMPINQERKKNQNKHPRKKGWKSGRLMHAVMHTR